MREEKHSIPRGNAFLAEGGGFPPAWGTAQGRGAPLRPERVSREGSPASGRGGWEAGGRVPGPLQQRESSLTKAKGGPLSGLMAQETPPPISPFVPVLMGFAEKYRDRSGRLRLRWRWGRILLVFCSAVVLGWGLKTVAGYYFFREYRGFQEVRWGQMFAYPFKRGEVARTFGDYHIARARELLQAGEYGQAWGLLRTGLVRSPANLEGRMILAQFEAIHRPHVAREVLEDGLQYAGEDIPYTRHYVQWLLLQREDEALLKFVQSRLPAGSEVEDPTPYQQLLAMAGAQASLFRGYFDQAENYILRYNLGRTIEGVLLQANVAWNRGQREQAVNRLEAYAGNRMVQALDPVYAALSRFYREMGRDREALRYAVRRSTLDPFAAQPRIEAMYFYSRIGDEERVRRESRSLIEEFRGDEGAMQALGTFATETGNLTLARRVYEVALESGFNIATFGVLFIEAHLVARDYHGAVAYCNDIVRENPTWLTRFDSVFNSLRSLAYYGVGNRELGDLYLNMFVQARDVRVETLVSVAHRFRESGMKEQARRILQIAFNRDPRNQLALSGIIQIDLDQGYAGELSANLRRLLLLRRPSYDLLKRAYEALSSDRFLFTEDRDLLLVDLRDVIQGV